MKTKNDSGYCHCACRDCFEIAIGRAGKSFCLACKAAGCEIGDDCQVDHCAECSAWLDSPADCEGCEHYGGES